MVCARPWVFQLLQRHHGGVGLAVFYGDAAGCCVRLRHDVGQLDAGLLKAIEVFCAHEGLLEYAQKKARTCKPQRTARLPRTIPAATQGTQDPIHENRVWSDEHWTAHEVKNEVDDGWAVAMFLDGEAEPALVGPWIMGRDKNPPSRWIPIPSAR